MILYFNSLFVALKGLWRFLVVVPFLVPSVFVLTISLGIGILFTASLMGAQLAIIVMRGSILSGMDAATVIGSAASGLGIIFIAILMLAWALMMSGINFIGLVAIRTALMAQGNFNPVELGRLVKNAGKYGFFFVVIYVALASLLALIGFLLSQLGLSDLPANFADDPDQALALFVNSIMVKMLFIIYAVLVTLLNAAMMVPMAASAWSSTEKVQPLDMFWGLGTALFTMLLVAVTGFAIHYYFETGPQMVQLISFLLGYSFASLSRDIPPSITWAEAQTMLIALGITLAVYYWQYVAAALGFLKRRDRLEAARIASLERPKSEWIDPAELRKERESQRSIYS